MKALNQVRRAELRTVGTDKPYYLAVNPVNKSLYLTETQTTVSIDYFCNVKPGYNGIAIGTAEATPVYALGPVGDMNKRPRCWWNRCSPDNSKVDFCGSVGYQGGRDTSQFLTYTVAPVGSAPIVPKIEKLPVRIVFDQLVDPTHRVDFQIQFVDGLFNVQKSFSVEPSASELEALSAVNEVDDLVDDLVDDSSSSAADSSNKLTEPMLGGIIGGVTLIVVAAIVIISKKFRNSVPAAAADSASKV